MTKEERRRRYLEVSDELMTVALSAISKAKELTVSEAVAILNAAAMLSGKGGGDED